MVDGELGRYPISIDIKVRMIKFWCKLIIGKQSKLSHICYKLLYNKKCLRDGFSLWIKNIQDITLILSIYILPPTDFNGYSVIRGTETTK
jgi:hypothetical protein